MLILRATTIAAWVLMGLTAPAMAQETTTGEANAEAAETESPVAPTTYIGAQHGDWAGNEGRQGRDCRLRRRAKPL